jgi:hypothetical protein
MYGRTTSGGTEYQPTIKAEMGAQITKRFNTPYGANNVEIEGGEFLQLPNFDTEHAEGPSHEMGGIKTNLPEGTRVYSDHLKPEGSKKTFAQLAKKYDISGYKKTIDDPFKKQVDKDTATLMLKRNQTKLDELFSHQQSMNGDSNGEMRDGGIHNAGFRALPKVVQDQILANMEYGGYQLPEYAGGGTSEAFAAYMKKNNLQNTPEGKAYLQKNTSVPTKVDTTPVAFQAPWLKNTQVKSAYNPLQVSPLTSKPSQQVTGSTLKPVQPAAGVRPNLKSAPKNVQALANNPSGVTKEGIPTYTEEDIKAIQKWDPNFNPAIETVPGLQKTQGSTYGEPTNQELFNKNYQWYTDKLKAEGKTFDPSKKGDVGAAQKAYHAEMTQRFIDAGYTPEEAAKNAAKYGYTTQEGVPNAFDDKLGKYTATRQLFNVAKKTPETPAAEKPATVETPKGNTYGTDIANTRGRYIRTPYDIKQSIPDIYGLAEAQSIFPYAIPEIDAPYVRPQTLNVQSELQDLDNMGTAAVRAGADPLATYIASMDSKQKAFQTKQNYDANARSQADQFNAQGQLSADQMNANSFNSVYNNLIGQARSNQSAIKQDQLSSLANNYADWNNSQTEKEFYYNNLIPSFNLDPTKTTEMEVANAQPFTRTKNPTTTPPKGKKGMLVSSKKSLTKFKK